MSLLVTVWHDAGELSADQFLGEVLLDLAAVDVRDSVVWYSLQEHDRDGGTRPRDGVVWYSLQEHDLETVSCGTVSETLSCGTVSETLSCGTVSRNTT